MRIVRTLLAAGALSAAAFVAAQPASAAPAFAGAASAQAGAPSPVIEARAKKKRYRHRHSYHYRYGYGPRYGYYAPRYYGGGVSRGGYPPQECVFDEGQGRYRPCSMGPR